MIVGMNKINKTGNRSVRVTFISFLYLLIAAILFLSLFADNLHNHPLDQENHHEECPVFHIKRILSVITILTGFIISFGECLAGPLLLNHGIIRLVSFRRYPSRAPPLFA